MISPDWNKSLIWGDSREVIKRIPDNSIDLILTDPPYNIGKHSTGNIPLPGRTAMNNDVAAWDWIDFNPEDWADDFIRILKPTGNLFVFTSYNQIGRWYNCLDHRFDTTNFMIWHKTNPAPKIFKAGFLNSCEMIFTCWNKKHTWNFLSQAEMHNFFESPICMRPERLSNPKHPAQKPVALLSKLLTIASNKGDIVFDPFMGVGSTGVAALNLGRRFIGVEIDNAYYQAARNRMKQDTYIEEPTSGTGVVSEPFPTFIHPETTETLRPSLKTTSDTPTQGEEMLQLSPVFPTLQPIIKWAGGKEKELKYILPNVPEHIINYYEPFVGGGSVFVNVRAEHRFINDLSSELIALYQCIAQQDSTFYGYARQIDTTWGNADLFFDANPELRDMYESYREGRTGKAELKRQLSAFCIAKREEITNILGPDLQQQTAIFHEEMLKNLFRKMTRMNELEHTRHTLPESDVIDNLKTAIKSAVYMHLRHLYNQASHDESLQTALFLFIRNYCYSGMFRYNEDGAFNVPYGGIAYNSKLLAKKLQYYQSASLLRLLRNTEICNLDFEDFLRKKGPGEGDFIFLDPPYDSEFSTYARNKFTHFDHERLANYLINDCKAKWMLVIKNTDFIYGLYDHPGVRIKTFEKEYLVSFMNRNDKRAVHLLITNYD